MATWGLSGASAGAAGDGGRGGRGHPHLVPVRGRQQVLADLPHQLGHAVGHRDDALWSPRLYNGSLQENSWLVLLV